MKKIFIAWLGLLLLPLVFGLASCGDGSSDSTSSSTDISAPTAPTDLLASALTPTQISLTWTDSTDNVGVTGYKINRDNQLLTTTTATSYLDSDLTPSTNNCYNVSAYDAAGNVSLLSNQSCTATPPI